MCQSKVFMVRDGSSELVAQDVIELKVHAAGVDLSTFFDEPKQVPGRIASIDFLKHTVTLVPLEEGVSGQR